MKTNWFTSFLVLLTNKCSLCTYLSEQQNTTERLNCLKTTSKAIVKDNLFIMNTKDVKTLLIRVRFNYRLPQCLIDSVIHTKWHFAYCLKLWHFKISNWNLPSILQNYLLWCEIYLWLVRVTFVVAFWLLPPNFGRWFGPTIEW